MALLAWDVRSGVQRDARCEEIRDEPHLQVDADGQELTLRYGRPIPGSGHNVDPTLWAIRFDVQRIEPTASRMSRVVASGCDIIGTCDASTSTVVAFARAAMNRSVAGGIA
jgi:hypothetical protein